MFTNENLIPSNLSKTMCSHIGVPAIPFGDDVSIFDPLHSSALRLTIPEKPQSISISPCLNPTAFVSPPVRQIRMSFLRP